MKLKKKEGITLVALVITVIILLILAGVAISLVIGENGIIEKTKLSKEETRGAMVEEQKNLWQMEVGTSEYMDNKEVKSLEEILEQMKLQQLITEEEKGEIENFGEVTIGSKKIVFKLNKLNPGLYNAETGAIINTWQELVANGDVNQENGILKRVNYNLIGKVVISDEITEIDSYAFDCMDGLKKVIIPNSVKTIRYDAFCACNNLIDITIPSSVKTIEAYAIDVCKNFEQVNVSIYNENYSSIDGVLYNKNKDAILMCPNKRTGEFKIPGSVITIGEYAFKDCTDITNITIPNSVITIGEWAFSNCTGITNITIPNSVITIGKFAFGRCNNLENIEIPNSITKIGSYAFRNCSNLKGIKIPNNITEIEEFTFSDCSSLTSIEIPNSITIISRYAFSGCTNLKTVNYTGTEDEWKAINIDSNNEVLKNATINE